ncbi:MAG: hypothetical protein JW928_06540 [Candidatus Aureabacteria bacterium]|nr:hypothetical protein [Candidatus Auribacterota bacterium]
MNDFKRLEELTRILNKARQDYWQADDRDKPRLSMFVLFILFIALTVSLVVFFSSPALRGSGFVAAVLFLQLIFAAWLGTRIYFYFRSKSELRKTVIQTNEEIVSINQDHFFKLMEEVKNSFPVQEKEFAEFFCCIAAFFSFDGFRDSDGGGGGLKSPLFEKWKIPEFITLKTEGDKILNTRLLRSVPEHQQLGILAIIRKNIQHVTVAESENTPAVDASNQNVFLIKRLSKDPSFKNRFSSLIDRFMVEPHG